MDTIKHPSEFNDNNPVFIVGLPRSGTTLLTKILNASEQIYFGTETHLFQFANKSKYQNKTEQFIIKEYLNPTKHIYLKFFQFNNLEWEQINNTSFKSIPDFLSYICNLEAKKKGVKRWGEKTPAHFYHLNDIFKSFPNALVVNIIRDPRAIFQSHQNVKWGIKSAYELARKFRANILVNNEYKDYKNYIAIKFEDLLINPKDVVHEICEFTGIQYKDKMLSSFNNEDFLNFNSNLEYWKINHPVIEKSKSNSWENEKYRKINAFIYLLLKKEIEEMNYTSSERNNFLLNLFLSIRFRSIDCVKEIKKFLTDLLKK